MTWHNSHLAGVTTDMKKNAGLANFFPTFFCGFQAVVLLLLHLPTLRGRFGADRWTTTRADGASEARQKAAKRKQPKPVSSEEQGALNCQTVLLNASPVAFGLPIVVAWGSLLRPHSEPRSLQYPGHALTRAMFQGLS
jgi:hypothetical protein